MTGSAHSISMFVSVVLGSARHCVCVYCLMYIPPYGRIWAICMSLNGLDGPITANKQCAIVEVTIIFIIPKWLCVYILCALCVCSIFGVHFVELAIRATYIVYTCMLCAWFPPSITGGQLLSCLPSCGRCYHWSESTYAGFGVPKDQTGIVHSIAIILWAGNTTEMPIGPGQPGLCRHRTSHRNTMRCQMFSIVYLDGTKSSNKRQSKTIILEV